MTYHSHSWMTVFRGVEIRFKPSLKCLEYHGKCYCMKKIYFDERSFDSKKRPTFMSRACFIQASPGCGAKSLVLSRLCKIHSVPGSCLLRESVYSVRSLVDSRIPVPYSRNLADSSVFVTT